MKGQERYIDALYETFGRNGYLYVKNLINMKIQK